MSVNLGEINGVEQVLSLLGGLVYVNDEPLAVKGVTPEEVESLTSELAEIMAPDEEGLEAMRNAKRLQFVMSMLERAVGEGTVEYLTKLSGRLQYRVLCYLGEADDFEEDMPEGFYDVPPRRTFEDDRHHHHHHHHDGDCCGHEHDHGDDCVCGHHDG